MYGIGYNIYVMYLCMDGTVYDIFYVFVYGLYSISYILCVYGWMV